MINSIHSGIELGWGSFQDILVYLWFVPIPRAVSPRFLAESLVFVTSGWSLKKIQLFPPVAFSLIFYLLNLYNFKKLTNVLREWGVIYLKQFSLPGKALIPKHCEIMGTFSCLLEVFDLDPHSPVQHQNSKCFLSGKTGCVFRIPQVFILSL